jgi:hypothetical protein
VSTSYAGAFSSSSQVFTRPTAAPGRSYYFQALQVSVSTSGIYIFTSDSLIDTIGYFYNSPFDPSNPMANLITDNDDDGAVPFQFSIEVNLEAARTYILVVTTQSEFVTGKFSVSAVGSTSVSLTSITASTSRPIVTRKFHAKTFLTSDF